MKSLDLVSAIVPTKNEAKRIETCLQSIKGQNRPIQIIVVDNFSRDNTVKIAKKYTPYVFQRGPERSVQRNFGAKKAKGDWLLFVDADMELGVNVVKEVVDFAQRGSFEAIVIPEKVKGDNFWARCLALEKDLYQNLPYLWAARFFKKEAFFKLGGFDEDLVAGEDWDLHQRAKKKGLKIGNIKSVIYNLEDDASLLKILKKKFYYAKNIKKYARKYPRTFFSQANFFSRLTQPASLRKMVNDPIHAIGLIFLKTAQAIGGVLAQIF